MMTRADSPTTQFPHRLILLVREFERKTARVDEVRRLVPFGTIVGI
jgi:hypothetical protein